MKYVIIGGGISGLYCAYQLSKRSNDIIVIEKADRLGGRIFSKNFGRTIVEAGAGGINSNHYILINLLKELGLERNLHLPNPSERSSERSYGQIDPMTGKIIKLIELKEFYKLIDNLNGLVRDDPFERKFAGSSTLFRFVERVYGINVAEGMRNEFGYHNDFMEQNALDGLGMFQRGKPFDPASRFGHLIGGMSTIIDRLKINLENKNIEIRKNTECVDIVKSDDKYLCRLSNGGTIEGENIILAVPKKALIKFKILEKVHYLLEKVISKALMRVYLVFPLDRLWFRDMEGVVTTKTILRQIIPVDKERGIIMIYVDGEAARSLFYLKKAKLLAEYITKLLRRLFDLYIPDPVQIFSKFWNEATHVWKPLADSETDSKRILKPLPEEKIYIIGEAYSTMQQWSEGALSTVNQLLDQLSR
ncbi:MAG: amino oxidase family protein [Hyperionvirus sp.]|uniref:Amino oxidase family protein n=1 Tax=Hyperionvirus sp. TaxID=2487770 RepID=A0A3G5AB84_9VIRU|nr:MAG: amino oxidase family protein [Hyperionvirus sp.]